MTDSIRLDMTIRGVGRLALATGTRKPEIAKKIRRTVEKLLEDGRLDLLLALKARRITPMQLHDLYQRRMLHTIPSAEAAVPLTDAWLAWIKGKDCSAAHKRSLAQSLRHLHATSNSTIHDVPALLEAARVALNGHPQSFRLCRAACQAFVKSALKRNHPTYAEVTAVEPMRVRAVRVKHPLSIAEFRAIAATLRPDFRAMAWTLVTTGMRVNELYGKWHVQLDRVQINGTKTRGAVRVVPLVGVCVPPTITYKYFYAALKAHGITPYDLRRTYATWLELAGVPRTRRKLYLGHGNADVTDLYEGIDVSRFIAEDRAKLQEMLGLSQGLRLSLAK